jgi:hypothetical protein
VSQLERPAYQNPQASGGAGMRERLRIEHHWPTGDRLDAPGRSQPGVAIGPTEQRFVNPRSLARAGRAGAPGSPNLGSRLGIASNLSSTRNFSPARETARDFFVVLARPARRRTGTHTRGANVSRAVGLLFWERHPQHPRGLHTHSSCGFSFPQEPPARCAPPQDHQAEPRHDPYPAVIQSS